MLLGSSRLIGAPLCLNKCQIIICLEPVPCVILEARPEQPIFVRLRSCGFIARFSVHWFGFEFLIAFSLNKECQPNSNRNVYADRIIIPHVPGTPSIIVGDAHHHLPLTSDIIPMEMYCPTNSFNSGLHILHGQTSRRRQATTR